MRIPPPYHDKSWQRFLAGFFLGLIFGWVFFLYHFGHVHEKLIMEINKQKITIASLEETIETLKENQDEHSEQLKKHITVQDVLITFFNEKDVKLSELTLHELRSSVENDLDAIRTKNIEEVSNSEELLIKAVENRRYVIGDKRYRLMVNRLVIYTTLKLNLRIEVAD